MTLVCHTTWKMAWLLLINVTLIALGLVNDCFRLAHSSLDSCGVRQLVPCVGRAMSAIVCGSFCQKVGQAYIVVFQDTAKRRTWQQSENTRWLLLESRSCSEWNLGSGRLYFQRSRSAMQHAPPSGNPRELCSSTCFLSTVSPRASGARN
jgi:hypothetical protein